MSDEKLKAAMEEIKTVLVRHDVGAVVVLAGVNRMEFYTHLSRSWSCATYDGHKVWFKAMRSDFPTPEAQRECVTRSVGMVMGFIDAMRHVADQMQRVAEKLSMIFAIEHRSSIE